MNDHLPSVLDLVTEALDSGQTPEVVCARCPELLTDVRRLLDQCQQLDAELSGLFTPRPPTAGPFEGPGTVIGPYALVEQIGEGGFGTVYAAEQVRPVRRRVALKLIKPGMDTRDVVARFASERQALALMDHPNIARVFDAGQTDAGRPYFVMELVAGVPVTAYCDAGRRTIRQRVELMVVVCRAVNNAHQKGVIHRDLKPSNVLVTAVDGAPVPKVIDFGVATAVTGRLVDQTLFTVAGGLVGTPAYMSPEQAEPCGSDVDTRTDVYGLGAVLYELLTGTTPIDPHALKAASPGDVARLIREADPPRPSARLAALGQATAAVAAARSSDPLRLWQQVRGDLDWVVMRALEKERSRRYDTASALADDLSRYLADEPVAAGPPGRVYRARRFARKYRAAVAVVALLTVALLMGVAGTALGLVREARQRRLAEARRAEAEAQRQTAQAVVAFLTEDVLARAKPVHTRDRTVSDALVKALIEPALQTLDERLRDNSLVRAAVRVTLAKTLVDLGRCDLAQPQARAAWQERRATLGDDHPDTIRALDGYVQVLELLGRHAEAEPLAQAAWHRSRRALGNDHPDTIMAAYRYAASLNVAGRRSDAEPLLYQVWQKRSRVLGDDHLDTIAAMGEYGLLLGNLKRHAEAEPLLREAWHRSGHALGDDHPNAIATLRNYAWFLHGLGRPAEAEPLARRACEQAHRVLGGDHSETAWAENIHALTLVGLGRRAEAEPLFRIAWERNRRVLGDDHPETILVRRNYATVLAQQGRWAEAAGSCRGVYESTRRVLGAEHPETIEAMSNYALTLANQGQTAAALAVFADAVLAARRADRARAASFAELLFAHADFLRQADDPAGAVPLLQEATELLRVVAPDDPNRGRDLYWLGTCLTATGRLADAEAAFRENYTYDLRHPGPNQSSMPGSLKGLLASLEAQGKPADVEAILAACRAAAGR